MPTTWNVHDRIPLHPITCANALLVHHFAERTENNWDRQEAREKKKNIRKKRERGGKTGKERKDPREKIA